MNRIPLTNEEASQIGGALQRLKEIGSSKIISPQHEAEQKGLVAFLQRILLEHCDELLASWYVSNNEYQVLINGFAALLSRATGTIQRAQQQRQQVEPEKAAAEAMTPDPESNIIKLKRNE